MDVGRGLNTAGSAQAGKVSLLKAPARSAVPSLPLPRQCCRHAPPRSLQRSYSCPLPTRSIFSRALAVTQADSPLQPVASGDSAPPIASAVAPIIAVQPDEPQGSTRLDAGALQHRQHILPDGAQLELLEIGPTSHTPRPKQPPLLFVHGAGHGAWCWEENFLPWFAQQGRHCYAVSLRGSGTSSEQCKDCPDTYAQSHTDLAHLIQSLPQPPVLIAHSMGGFFAQRYLIELADKQQVPPVSGVVMMASAFLTACMPNRQWWQAQPSCMHGMKVMWWMMTASLLKSAAADKSMLFSADLDASDFTRYHKKLRGGRQTMPANLKEVQGFLPKVQAAAEAAKQLPVPIAVTMAGDDALILPFQVEAAADYFGVEPILLPGLAHDLMLDTRWEVAAKALDVWLQDIKTP